MLGLAALLPQGSGERLSLLKGVARWSAEETGQPVPALDLLLLLAGAYKEVRMCALCTVCVWTPSVSCVR